MATTKTVLTTNQLLGLLYTRCVDRDYGVGALTQGNKSIGHYVETLSDGYFNVVIEHETIDDKYTVDCDDSFWEFVQTSVQRLVELNIQMDNWDEWSNVYTGAISVVYSAIRALFDLPQTPNTGEDMSNTDIGITDLGKVLPTELLRYFPRVARRKNGTFVIAGKIQVDAKLAFILAVVNSQLDQLVDYAYDETLFERFNLPSGLVPKSAIPQLVPDVKSS